MFTPTEPVRKLLSEFVGTFALVFAGTGAIVINQASGGAITHPGIALTFGLIVLGLIILFICTQYHLNDDVPAWGTEVFHARMVSRGSPEQRAAIQEEKRTSMSPLRFYRWSGITLLVAGIAGFVWQQLQ